MRALLALTGFTMLLVGFYLIINGAADLSVQIQTGLLF